MSQSNAKAWLRFGVFLAVVGTSAVLLRTTDLRHYLEPETLLELIERLRTLPGAPLIFALLIAVLFLLGSPTTPLVLVGGAVFGPWIGFLANYLGVVVGAVLTYAFARGLGYELIRGLVGDRLRRLEVLLGRRGFWSLVRLRFLPIPFFIANSGLALIGVKPVQLASSTLVAFVPVMFVWSYFGAALASAGTGERAGVFQRLALALVLLLLLTFVPTRIVAWRRSRRYRALLELRQQRQARAQQG